MSNTIFDLVEADIPEGKEGFFEVAKRAPQPKDNSFYSSIKDYAKTFAKGTAEGLGRLGRMMGPLQGGTSTEEQLEQQTEALDELLPTEEGFVQKGLRRGLKELPSVAAFPGTTAGIIPRAIGAGYAGETAKELGAPEWIQAAAELTSYIGPDITKKLLSSGSNKEIIEFAKKMGMTDAEITPLLQSEFKQKWLSKLAPKRGQTAEALKATKSAISNVYSGIQKSPEAANVVGNESLKAMYKHMAKIIEEMPAGVREVIKKDAADLVSKPVTGETLINFYSDINHYLGPETKQLSLLKEPIKKALGTISPQLEKDFTMINDLYSKYYNISGKLKPTLTSDIVSAAETVGILGSILTGQPYTLGAIFTEKAARKLSQQMLINPHFQQLSKKMIVAINENKFGLAKKITQQFADEIRKSVPEIADKLQKMTDEELKEFLQISNPQQKEETKLQKIRLK